MTNAVSQGQIKETSHHDLLLKLAQIIVSKIKATAKLEITDVSKIEIDTKLTCCLLLNIQFPQGKQYNRNFFAPCIVFHSSGYAH